MKINLLGEALTYKNLNVRLGVTGRCGLEAEPLNPQTAAMSEWGALESELNAIGAPTTTATVICSCSSSYCSVRVHDNTTTSPNRRSTYPPPAGGTTPSHPPPPANPPPSSSGFDDLSDVFSGSGALTSLYGNQPQAPPTFTPPPQPNPFGMAGQPPPPNYPPPPVQEPSITMDLMDAICNPQQNTTIAYPIGMGVRMPGLGMGPPAGYGTGQFQFGGGMGGFSGGPQPPPFQDIFSLPADPLLDSNFSQPLLPTNTGGAGTHGGGQPPQGAGGKIDAFSDLVSIARDKTSKPEPTPPTIFQAPPTNTETPPPLPYRPPDLDFTDAPPTTSGPAPSGFDDTFGALPPAPRTGGGFGGGMDMFGDSFTSRGGGAAPPPSGADSWIY
uniref:Uncharacterized protein n=1 Tax=Amphimedon queenslandica TaxID=400682 RepID=A0A1X7UXF7_AMPQE